MQTNKKNVLLIEHIHPEARKRLETYTNIISDIEQIQDADALIDRNFKVDKDLLDRATRLKVVAVHGTGMDAIDLEETRKHGVDVFCTPGLNARSVAELNVALALDLSRNIHKAASCIKDGEVLSHAGRNFSGHEISGKTFGMIGVGNITKQTAQMLQNGFGAKILGWSRSFTQEKANQLGFVYCETMEEVLRNADIIIMGLAACKETYHMIGEAQLKMCKPSALLINTARGSLIDETALYHALVNGWILGAASDVFEEEPVTTDNPLVSLDQFIPLPHLGANTDEALYRVGMAVVDGIFERLQI